jgi:hypothetical protein
MREPWFAEASPGARARLGVSFHNAGLELALSSTFSCALQYCEMCPLLNVILGKTLASSKPDASQDSVIFI